MPTASGSSGGAAATPLAARLYWGLAAACLAQAASGLTTQGPTKAVSFMFGSSIAHSMDHQLTAMLHLDSSGMPLAAGIAAALAAGWQSLGPGAADLLRLALAGMGLVHALLIGGYGHTMIPKALLIELLCNVLLAVLPAVDRITLGDLTDQKSPRSPRNDPWQRLRPPSLRHCQSPTSLPFALVCILWALVLFFVLSGGMLLLTPQAALQGMFGLASGAAASLMAGVVGTKDLVLVPACLLLLKGAAEGGALASRPARLLAAGLAAAAAAHLAVEAPLLADSQGRWMLAANAICWGAVLLGSLAALWMSTAAHSRAPAAKHR